MPWPVHTPVPTPSVHGESQRLQCLEASLCPVSPGSHRPHDAGEDEELVLLGTEEGLRLEEGNDPMKKVITVPDHVHQAGVP